MPRVLGTITATDWAFLGADKWLSPPPLVVATSRTTSGIYFVVYQGAPTQYGGIPTVTLGEDDQDVTLVRASDGAQEDPGQIWDWYYWGNYFTQTDTNLAHVYDKAIEPAHWIQDGVSKWIIGYLARIELRPGSAVDPAFNYWVQVPYSWYGVDLAALLFAFLCFHSPGGTGARAYLDRDALLDYSTGTYSYLRRRRLFTSRRVGESLIDHLKRLAIQSGAMMRWGGFVSGSNVTQQWGLGVLDWDRLREITTVYDADPAGDAGRDMFLTTPITVRHTDEYILNKSRLTWGGGFIQTLTDGTTTRTPEAPFSTREPQAGAWRAHFREAANVVSYEDPESIEVYGERPVEAEAVAIMDRPSADQLALTRWTEPRRVVEFGMGPLHWDFDCGDVIHVRHPEVGLDGTEDLLVTDKTINWASLHAVITALQVNLEPAPMDPTDAALDSTCQLWVQANGAFWLDGNTIESWDDDSGNGRHLGIPAGMVGPIATSGPDGIAGYPVARFQINGTAYGLADNSGLYEADTIYRRGFTVIAVVRVRESAPAGARGWIFASFLDGLTQGWGVGLNESGGAQRWNVHYRDATSSGGLFSANADGRDLVPPLGQWVIYTAVMDVDAGGVQDATGYPEMAVGAESVNGEWVALYGDSGGVPPSMASGTALGNFGIGHDRYNSAAIWPGDIAEVQVYSVPLRPQVIRRLHAGIRGRYPGEGL